MKKSVTTDMTSGSETKHILRFALPVFIGNIVQQLYNVADTAIVGKYIGDDALAAVGATGSITFFFYNICFGLSVGAGVMVSQYFGADEKAKLKSSVWNSAVVTAVFGVIVSVLSVLLTEPVLRLLNTPENLMADSAGYMKIACGGTLAVAFYNWINSVMRSLGNTKAPLFFLCTASVINIVLDIVFVTVCGFGINGAAFATIIAQGISAVGCIIYAFSKTDELKLHKSDMKVSLITMKKCIKIGVPIALQNGLVSVSMIALQRVTNGFGEVVMAAYTSSMRVEQLVQQPFSSLNAAISSFVGQNTGAGESERVVKGYHVTLRIGIVFSLIITSLFMVFAEPIVMFFISGEDAVMIAAAALRITSACYIPLGLIHITRGFLNGAGDAGYALLNGLAEVVSRIGFSLILTNIASISFWGIWYTTAITWIITGVMSVIRYKCGIWKKKKIV